MLILLLTLITLSCTSAVRIHEEIYLPDVNQSFFIKDEVYTLRLVPLKQVPKNIISHTLFTGSKDNLVEVTKRYLNRYKRSLDVLAYDDYLILQQLLGEDVPHVTVDKTKRSIGEYTTLGRRIIQINENVRITCKVDETMKRMTVPLGTQFCLHIPFVTQCDNSASFDAVKATLEAHIEEARAEIDNIRAVSNARWDDLENSMADQNVMLADLSNTAASQAESIRQLANLVTYQGIDMIHVDNIISAHIKHIQYMSSAIINFANSLESTDPRSVVAQPALTELFDGYLRSIDIAISEGYIPIVSETTFNFNETLLPVDVARNSERIEGTFENDATIYSGVRIQIGGATRRFIGTFLPSHPVMEYISGTDTYQQVLDFFGTTESLTGTLRCFSLFGFNVLTDADLSFFSSFVNGPKVEQSLDKCDIHRLKVPSSGGGTNIYQFLAEFDSRMIHFYSNCPLEQLPGIDGTIGYLSTYPVLGTTGSPNMIGGVDVNERHFVTDNCFINLNPIFVGMTYQPSENATRIIENIPFGFRTNQFTINPAGELSSSLKFLKTEEWIQVYSITRSSQNSVIVSEIADLANDIVLFHADGDSIIDASDSFLDGNNGRDCIVKSADYDDRIVDCFFQNNQNAFPSASYFRGEIVSTGIARHNRKFDFDIAFFDPSSPDLGYEVTLKPKADADFNFFVELDDSICPSVSYQISKNRCRFTLFYTGTEDVTLGSGETVIFDENQLERVILQPSTEETIIVGGKNCLVLNCVQTNNIASITIETPNFSVIPDDIQNLVDDETFTRNITEQLNQLALLQEELRDQESKLRALEEEFNSLDFNISDAVPFQNFTELRNQVDELFQELEDFDPIVSNQEVGCEGIFGTFECFLEDLLGTLIVIGIIAAILAGAYFVIQCCIL